MVEPGPAVGKHPREPGGIAGAGAEVDHRATPASPGGRREKALNVDRIGAPLKTMEREQAWAPCRRDRAMLPQAVWRCDPVSHHAGRNSDSRFQAPDSRDLLGVWNLESGITCGLSRGGRSPTTGGFLRHWRSRA